MAKRTFAPRAFKARTFRTRTLAGPAVTVATETGGGAYLTPEILRQQRRQPATVRLPTAEGTLRAPPVWELPPETQRPEPEPGAPEPVHATVRLRPAQALCDASAPLPRRLCGVRGRVGAVELVLEAEALPIACRFGVGCRWGVTLAESDLDIDLRIRGEVRRRVEDALLTLAPAPDEDEDAGAWEDDLAVATATAALKAGRLAMRAGRDPQPALVRLLAGAAVAAWRHEGGTDGLGAFASLARREVKPLVEGLAADLTAGRALEVARSAVALAFEGAQA